jgi:hypothetical protein
MNAKCGGFLPAAALVAGMACSPAHAELITGHTATGYPFAAGGIGTAERQALKQIGNDYSLQIVMATRSGEYVADNEVKITDRRGNVVIDGVIDAPWLMVKVPPGRYTVDARFARDELMRHVSVPANETRRIYLHFDASNG